MAGADKHSGPAALGEHMANLPRRSVGVASPWHREGCPFLVCNARRAMGRDAVEAGFHIKRILQEVAVPTETVGDS